MVARKEEFTDPVTPYAFAVLSTASTATSAMTVASTAAARTKNVVTMEKRFVMQGADTPLFLRRQLESRMKAPMKVVRTESTKAVM